jgi:biopolymer transport protein ExbB/TolQ
MSTLAQLPSDLTPMRMLLTADLVVKLTIAILVAASLATWTILLGKTLELRVARQRLRAALDVRARRPRWMPLAPAWTPEAEAPGHC